jgi:hypothetical protein
MTSQQLTKVFSGLTFPQILSIAEEFYFHTDEDHSKAIFEKKFADFLIANGYAEEVITRYKPDAGRETTETEKTIRLFPFQCLNKRDMIIGCERSVVFLNTSEPGTGKTYSTLSFAETEKRPLAVVCPKAVMLNWYLLAVQAEVEILFICNYEMLITGQMYHFGGNVDLEKLPVVPNPYLTKSSVKKAGRAKEVIQFEWKNLPEKTLFVFDEAHLCKNVGTQRTETLHSAYRYAAHPENIWKSINIVLLSGTIIEKKDNLVPFMWLLGFANSPTDKSMINAPGFSVRAFGQQLLAERRMTRATMKEAKSATGDNFTSDVRTKKFRIAEEERVKIQKACEDIRNALKGFEGKKSKNHLAVRLQKRQEIETLKLALLLAETKALLKDGWSVSIFLNFIPSHEALCSMFRKELPDIQVAVIRGGQTAFERLKQIEDWQQGKARLIVVMYQAGGTGIGLHDVFGTAKRYGLHSPPESATMMVQALGRLDRLGSKSSSVQRIVLIEGTIEEKIGESLVAKMSTIGDLNGDEESRTDNIFLFDEIHNFEHEEKASSAMDFNRDVKIKITIDKTRGTFKVIIPESLVTAFENGIPQTALLSMKALNDGYQFSIEHRAIVQEFLTNLVQ